MKVIFDDLNKITLVTSAYQILKEDFETKTNKRIKPLTKKQIISIEDLNDVDKINGIYLGLKFKGNYVEFDDLLMNLYINLLFKMKTDSSTFVDKMKEDFIIEFEYKEYLKEIKMIENQIDECKTVMKQVLNQLMLLRVTLKLFPEDREKLFKTFNTLNEQKDKLKSNMDALFKLRIKKIKQLFELEGYPQEVVRYYE